MPEPLFILCPGRSFSSVVCAIIGQHPECYGLPELNLFLADTLGEAIDRQERTGRTASPGLLRTLAQLHSGEQTEETVEEAKRWIRANRDLTGREVLDHFQDLVGPRILVDKSPANVIADETLQRLVDAYPNAFYLQLLRHPRSRGKSHHAATSKMLRFRLLGNKIDYEQTWTRTHRRIHAALSDLPMGHRLRIKGEEFLQDLRLYLPQICEWLGISTDPTAIDAMLRPEDSPYSRFGPPNARQGANGGFLESPQLDMERLAHMTEPTLEAPMDWAPDRHFSEETRSWARLYGYR